MLRPPSISYFAVMTCAARRRLTSRGHTGVGLRSVGFTQIPNVVLRGQAPGGSLSLGARVLYGLILDYSNGGTRLAYPSQATLAKHLCVTDRTVRTYLRELEAADLVLVKRTGRGQTNYLIPLLVADRKRTSGQLRKSASEEEHLPESDNAFGLEEELREVLSQGVR